MITYTGIIFEVAQQQNVCNSFKINCIKDTKTKDTRHSNTASSYLFLFDALIESKSFRKQIRLARIMFLYTVLYGLNNFNFIIAGEFLFC